MSDDLFQGFSRWFQEACSTFPAVGGRSFTRQDLDRFLTQTANESEGPAERLRILAVYLENEFPGDIGGWIELSKIYRLAQELDPTDARVHWARATYEAVDRDALLEFLPGYQTWRVYRLRAQSTCCAFLAGDTPNATVEFRSLLNDLLALDSEEFADLASDLDLTDLREFIREALPGELLDLFQEVEQRSQDPKV